MAETCESVEGKRRDQPYKKVRSKSMIDVEYIIYYMSNACLYARSARLLIPTIHPST